jgi:hypothetical protein
MEENVYEAERRLTHEILRRLQGILRDQSLAKPNLKNLVGVKVVESIVERRAHGEFPTPLHEIVELGKVLEEDHSQDVKRWARQRIHHLKKRITTPRPEKHRCSGMNSSRSRGPCMNYGTVEKNGSWWCKLHIPKY